MPLTNCIVIKVVILCDDDDVARIFRLLLPLGRPLFNPCVDIAHISWGSACERAKWILCAKGNVVRGWDGKDYEQRLSVFHLFSLYDMQIMFSFRSFGCEWLEKASGGGAGGCKAIPLPTPCEQIILYNILIKTQTMNKFCAMSVSFSPLSSSPFASCHRREMKIMN